MHATATAEWQKLEIDGTAAPDRKLRNAAMNGGQWPYAERAATCTWWIKAPAGKTVEVRVDSLYEKIKDEGWNLDCLSEDCSYQGIEVKYGDMKRTGPRVCCPTHAKELGTVTSKGPLAIIRHWTILDGIKATISYRTSDKPGECNDQTPNCAKNGYKHCSNSKYENVMKRRCPKTCKLC
ncbi:Protein NAS-27 [Aphelenchoides avenae]|nr:Protein NAS-27 [Aphelenchus avenae]